jgi:pyruvate, water dikinase
VNAPYILWLDDKAAPNNPLLGGKFSSLAEITATGTPVPRGFGITTAAYRDFVAAAGLEAEIQRIRGAAAGMALADIKGQTAALVNGIMTAALPADLEEQVRDNYKRLGQRTGVPDVPVAVRSSGESEDLEGASFAGQYDTFLWICGIDAVLHHMRRCWASMYGEAVLSYQQDGLNVISRGDFAICVGIQHMVQARAAGVMFTLDPINGDRSKIAIEACWGLGEGVVKGDVTPSQFTVDKVSFEIIKRKINTQTEEYRFDPTAGGVELTPIEEARQAAVCLSDQNILDLATLAKCIERDRNTPQDIEWAVNEANEIWTLQVRAETVWSRKAAAALLSPAKSPVSHLLARMSGLKIMDSAKTNDK